MSRIATLVAIDQYASSPLHGCVADARALRALLERNDDGGANFNCHMFTDGQVTRANLRTAVQQMFTQQDLELALFYFAGHGIVRGSAPDFEGVLKTVDGTSGDEGVTMQEILSWANGSSATERIIVLDCCHAGAVEKVLAMRTPVPIAKGVSILAAARSDQQAVENGSRGLFSSYICAALDGGAADVRGFVTAANTYAYVDEIMTPWDHRPLFRSSVTGLKHLRRAKHAVSDEELRQIPVHFPTADYDYKLNEKYEQTCPNHDPALVTIFGLLQNFRGARLVEPVGERHMYYAAVNRKSCRLTPLGQAYWQQVRNKKF